MPKNWSWSRQVLSIGRRPSCGRFSPLWDGCYQRVRVRLLTFLSYLRAHHILRVFFCRSPLLFCTKKKKIPQQKPTRGSLKTGEHLFLCGTEIGAIFKYIQKMDRYAGTRRKLVKKDFCDFWSPAGGASLCTILRLRLRRTSFGSSSGRLGPCRTSRWSKSCFCNTFFHFFHKYISNFFDQLFHIN